MTVVPPGEGGPGEEPEPYVPSGLRRSTYTPPPADVEPPAFDDDALADALAAQVASYTSPIPVVPSARRVPPAFELEPEVAEPENVAEPEPVTEPGPVEVPTVDPSVSPTLEAIERLESELRRRAEEAQAASGVLPIVPEPAADAGDEPAVDEPGGDEPAVDEAPAAAFPWSEPAPDARRFPAPPTYLHPAPPAEAESTSELPPVFSIDAEPESAAESASVGEPEEFAEPESLADPEPPALVEPPAPGGTPYVIDAPPPVFAPPPVSAPIDLPPPAPTTGAVDIAHLPPPIGLQPAPIPPYDPTTDPASGEVPPPTGAPVDLPPPPGPLAPPPADFEALLATSVPPLHPDDLGGEAFAFAEPTTPGPEEPSRFAPPPVEAQPAADHLTAAEDDDVVDDVDRAFGTGAIAVDATGSASVPAPPSQPIPTMRLAEDEPALVDEEAQQHPALLVETAGVEPTALDLRAGRAARLFWLWFAANSSVLSLSLGAVLFGIGMSLRQALVAILIGVALSFLPLGLVTLAGKWSGQPTMIVSRASFGVVGNVVPTVVAVLSRVFWGGALLWMLAAGVGRVLADAGLDAGLGEQVWTFVALAASVAIVLVVAIFGYGLLARVQLVLSVLTAVLVVGLVVLTFPHLDVAAAQRVADGPWMLLVSGVVLVFSFVGLAWVHSSADVARYQRPESDGGSTMLWATFGATLPAFILVAWGAMLAASDPIIADGLATNPLHTIAALLPVWYPAPLLAAVGLGLLSGAVLTVYSGGFALQALGVGLRRPATTAIAGALVLVAALALVLVAGDARGLIRDAATTIAVPVAAWAGIVATEMMIRRRRFQSDSLLRRGGVYPDVRWVNLVGFVVITALGFGFTSATLPGLDWQGYLLPFLGLPEGDPLLTSDIGVLGALVLGIVLPLATAVPAIRRQERALVD